MTSDDILLVQAVIAEHWPGRHNDDPEARAAVWREVLGDVDVQVAVEAVNEIARSGAQFPPGSADIIRQITRSRFGDFPDVLAVRHMIEASSHGRGLPPDCHPVVRDISSELGGPATLANWEPDQIEREIRNALTYHRAKYEKIAIQPDRAAIGESTGGPVQIGAGLFREP